MGAIANDGGMGTVLTAIGDIKENTIKVLEADGTRTSFRAAGKSAPVLEAVQDGDMTIEFDLMSMDKEVMADLMGGTVTGDPGEEVWNRPLKKPVIERSFEIEDEEGVPMQLPRVSLVGTIQNVYSPTDVNVIRVKGVVMQPKKAGTAAVIW